MLHNAGRANTPIVNVVGANASYHQPNYPEHELINGRITDLARAVSHWVQEARSASNLGELGAEAAALAKTGKICTLVAPTNWHWDEANPPPQVAASPSARPRTAAEAQSRAPPPCWQNGQENRARARQSRAARRGPRHRPHALPSTTGAVLLSETFPSLSSWRCGENRPPVETIPYRNSKFCVQFSGKLF